MKIHLLSDIHLESGPYELPAGLDCDVIVAAGDIGVGLQGLEWLKTLGKPVVYVAGNHEYWSKRENPVDMFDLQDQLRAAAAGSNVHYLENDAVVIDGVRFIGATLWTSYGDFHPELLDEGKFMNDVHHIYCPRWYADPENLANFEKYANRFNAAFGWRNGEWQNYWATLQSQVIARGKFHQIVAYLEHKKTMRYLTGVMADEAWAQRRTENPEGGKTVIVTHHQPFFESLRRSGVNHDLIGNDSRRHWQSGWREPCGELHVVAAYASDLRIRNWIYPYWSIDRQAPEQKVVDLWCAGHRHDRFDYEKDGMRVACNPRGRYSAAWTDETAQMYGLFGYPISDEMIERSQARHAKPPFIGDCNQFEPSLVIDTENLLGPVFRADIAAALPRMRELRAKVEELAPHMASEAPGLVKLVSQAIQQDCGEFIQCVIALERMLDSEKEKRLYNSYPPLLTPTGMIFGIGRDEDIDPVAEIGSVLAAQAEQIAKFEEYLRSC